MHILTKLAVKVHPVLLDAAKNHFFCSGVEIAAFKLPLWMYQKLRREPGFRDVGTGQIWGWYLGYKVIASADPVPKMYEKGCCVEYEVFQEVIEN